jgi:hypothetical protein
VKAYGLLPLERGEAEVLERYLFLQDYARGSNKFGSKRKTNERAAAQFALNQLARVAGYEDPVRFEWAMEARLAQETAAHGQSWQIGDYEATLSLVGCEPELAIQHGGRRLRSMPSSVRHSATYDEIKGAIAHLRDQASRFRKAFEERMVLCEPFSRADLENIVRLPVARDLLSRLILRTNNGALGLFDPTRQTLSGLADQTIVLTDPMLIAHPYHLFGAEELAAWQGEIVRRKVTQPFKQAFRELYLLTPAERETRSYSNRFAGHVLDGRVAARLLQSRDWQIPSGDTAVPAKPFPRLNLEACFDFPDAGSYLPRAEIITSDRIFFRAISKGSDVATDLNDIPPIIFSEVMRDADLVVSVAQRDGEVHLSIESYERRAELVTALLADLGLSALSTDGHFARVRGKLANYRVHLGSGAIHIEPGNYLCIVPARFGQRSDRLFLPFAEPQDSKLSEIVSKVLLLANDDQIRDESILWQIRAAARSRPQAVA